MNKKWREKDVYAPHIKPSYNEVLKSMDNIKSLVKWKDKKEVANLSLDFINASSKIKKKNRAYLIKFRQYYGDRDNFELKLKSLKLLMIENNRRYRIKTIRRTKQVYKKSYSLSKKFKKAVGQSRFKPKTKKQARAPKQTRYLYPSSNKKHKQSASTRHYNHKEVLETIEHYAAFAKNRDHEKAMFKLTDDYRKDKRDKTETRIYRNNKIIKDKGARVKGWPIIRELEKSDKLLDQEDRNLTIKKARNYYHHNYSLTKKFKEAKSKTIEKEKKDIDKIN